MIKSYKFRLYPTKDQEVLLAKHFGCVRFIYNWALDYRTKVYKEGGKYINYQGMCSNGALKECKLENEWLKDVNSQSLISSISHNDKAYANFFAGRAKFPRFKSKYDYSQSFDVPQFGRIDVKGNRLYIPKFKGGIYCKAHRNLAKGKIGTFTVSKTSSGKYFVSVLVHCGDAPQKVDNKEAANNALGIDFGLRSFMTFSDGEKINSPQYLKNSLERLNRRGRKHSKKQPGSKNRDKERVKLARFHEHVTNQRKDFLHKLSHALVVKNQSQVICVEDLCLKGMTKIWGRKVNDLSWFELTRQLEYKSEWYGKHFIKIGRFEPSSQICSHCGYRNRAIKDDLNIRKWTCPACSTEHDRDINAAINIRDFGVQRLTHIPQELRKSTPLERKAKSSSNTTVVDGGTFLVELGKKIPQSEVEAQRALALG